MKPFKALLILLSLSSPLLSQELYKSLQAHEGEALTVAISSDGTTILTGGTDKRVYLWEAKTGKKLKVYAHSETVNQVDYNSSNNHFVAASANRLIIFEASTGKPYKLLKGHESEITSIDFSPVNNNVASGDKDKKVMLSDGDNGSIINNCLGHSKTITKVSYNADGTLLASASEDNTVRLWDAASGVLKNTIETDMNGIYEIAFSADGKYLAIGGGNGTIALYDPQTAQKLINFNHLSSKINALAFSPDVQYLAAAGDDNNIVLWDLNSRQIKNEKNGIHTKAITDIVFSDKGDVFVSVDRAGKLNIWDTKILNIGKKKFVEMEELANVICSPITINDDNNNGIIEVNEKASLKFTLENKGKGNAFNINSKLDLETIIRGLEFPKETSVGNLDAGGIQEVSIPLSTSENLETSAGIFILNLEAGNGRTPSPIRAHFQTRGVQQYAYIMVTGHSFSSANGKAVIGAPITLKMSVKNTSKGKAENVKINFLLPDKVLAVDKLHEVIEKLEAGESKDIEMQFYADKDFAGKSIKLGLTVEGVAFTNANDLIFSLDINQPLPGSEDYTAAVESTTPETITYRGGGDPLKGLNVAKTKEMTIGKYYALIIGIDQYSGSWTPLHNAVNDAKAVEGLLKQKYKFDFFKTLYDGQASRAGIIQELEWLIENVRPIDNVFIYYSGHGEYKEALKKGYWVPVDAKISSTSAYISNSDLQTYLGGINSKHTLLVSDACFSGDIFRGNTVTVPFQESEKYYTEVHNLTSRQAITSGGIEPVMDGGKDGHSVFAYYFLKTLNTNESRYFDAGQLYTKIKIPVINNSEQTPRISPIKQTGDEGGQFIFIKK